LKENTSPKESPRNHTKVVIIIKTKKLFTFFIVL